MAKAIGGLVLSERLRLSQYDPEGDSYVVFQRPSRMEAERIASMQAQSVLEWTSEEHGVMRQRERVPIAVLESEMVAMSLVECNVPWTKEGDLVFTPGVSCREQDKPLTERVRGNFYEVWHKLPNDLCENIIAELQRFHPPFDWRKPDRGED